MSKKENENKQNPEKIQESKGLIAISNTLARAKNGMSMQEKKLMAIYLSKIEWKNLNNNLEIWVEKREIMELLGSKMDTTDQSPYLRKLAQSMVHHSELHFDGKDRDEWEDMPLFTRRKSTKNQLMIEIYHHAAKLIEGLNCEYITLFLGDILRFDSDIDGLRGYKLYEYLRLHSDTRRINSRIISTREFKELFDIPKDGKGSYMREKGGFDRNNFEKKVIEPVLKLVAKCEHVVLHNYGTNAKGEPILYKKIKKNGLIQGYEVSYSINKYHTVIKRETIIDVQAKPEVLKVAQDVIEGKKRVQEKKKEVKKSSFTNFDQRGYSPRYYELMEKLNIVGQLNAEEQAELEQERRKANGFVTEN